MIDFTLAEKSRILDVHNKLRNDVTTGKLIGFSPAVRMGTMTWDDELAAMAALNVKRCVYGHDECHNTINYPMSGQNLAYVKGYGYNTFSRTKVLEEFDTMINDWFLQYKNANMDIIRNFQNNGVIDVGFTFI